MSAACVWRPIEGFGDRYEVSSDGRVRSVARVVTCRNGTPKPFKQQEKRQTMVNGFYWRVILYDENLKRHNCNVHILVCEAFHGERPPGQQVRHLNGVSTDNRAENLAWGTQSENMVDRVHHGTDRWASRTHCCRGHEYTPENTWWYTKRTGGRPARNCRTCIRERGEERRRRRGVPIREFKTHCPAGHPYDAENTRVYNGCRSCKTCHRESSRKRWEQQKPGPRPLATHCIQGHPFDEANTYFRRGGGRSCRICMRASDRRHKARRRAEASK